MADDLLEKMVDKILEDVRKDVENIYSRALKESRQKADKYFDGFSRRDAQKQKQVEAGDLEEDEYLNWRNGQMLTGTRYNEMVDVLAKDYAHADQIASSIIGGYMPDAYAVSHNYATFEVEKASALNTSYTLYNRQAVERLIKDGDIQLKPPKPDIPKDERWNRQHIKAELAQGVLQGESIKDVSKRLEKVTNMDRSAAMRNARTAMTATMNVGKLDGYKRLQEMGLNTKKQWVSSHDSLTRESHIAVDQEIVGLDEPFSNGLQFPGDPDGEAAEVYNCRCTMVSVFVDFDSPEDRPRDYTEYDAELPDMSYDEWVKAHEQSGSASEPARHFVNGVDLTDTWQRRPDQFQYEIEDIINAQGFDGLPKVVSANEFDKIVADSGIYCQRIYGAEDTETVLKYQDMLYNGKWYVDCSNGGAAYGQGMYCGTGIGKPYETKELAGVMNNYADSSYNIIETFTLDKNARTITSSDLGDKWIRLSSDEMARCGNDRGVYAAMMGYDAITKCGRKEYAVVLNRTACVFKEGTTIQGFDEIHEHWMNWGK